jgi:hypothetical protein
MACRQACDGLRGKRAHADPGEDGLGRFSWWDRLLNRRPMLVLGFDRSSGGLRRIGRSVLAFSEFRIKFDRQIKHGESFKQMGGEAVRVSRGEIAVRTHCASSGEPARTDARRRSDAADSTAEAAQGRLAVRKPPAEAP